MEQGIHKFEESIMKAFSASPFGNILKEMLSNMAGGPGSGKDGGQSDSAMQKIFDNMTSPFEQH